MVGGMCGRGLCMVGVDMCGRGNAWQGGMCGSGHAWQEGCVWQERRRLQRTVRILLECFLVSNDNGWVKVCHFDSCKLGPN